MSTHSSTATSDSSSHTLTEVPTHATNYTTKSAGLLKVVASHAFVTPKVLNHNYAGSGTDDDPFVVEFLPNDPRDPLNFSNFKKWSITLLVAFATLAVSFVSSAYSGSVKEILEDFHSSDEVVTLGISLFVVGFAIGPLIWAPFSELYGRQILFFITYGVLTAFNAGAAGSQNIQTLIILRFWAGAWGSSPLTNAGGVIADMFPAAQRGLATSIFAAAPFMGPALGPVVGGFIGENIGWRWNEGVMAIFTGVLWIVGAITIPETYAPVLLRKRAAKLSKKTGKVYRSGTEVASGPPPTLARSLKTALSRPWILLFREPIVLLLSIYMAIIYGTLYMMFAAFPIVFQQERGWSEGVGGLAFIGVAVGMLVAVGYTIPDNKRYMRAEAVAKANGARGAPPEARLPPSLIGSVCLPVGLFIFAWTNSPSIHWIVCIIFTAPFGFGMVLVFLSIMNYLIDAYTIYAASTLAANSVLRSLFGAIFPLFTTYMYRNLGIHWASSIPAFLALACVPFPFLFYKYGPVIRMKCKFAREADEAMERLHNARGHGKEEESSEEEEKEKVQSEIRQGSPQEELVEDDKVKQANDERRSHEKEAMEDPAGTKERFVTPPESIAESSKDPS
ncbi:MAG: hypothetical protein Q9191_004830 [Dirinaria sp. TL-2023a]